jgi:hypothetical protein
MSAHLIGLCTYKEKNIRPTVEVREGIIGIYVCKLKTALRQRQKNDEP